MVVALLLALILWAGSLEYRLFWRKDRKEKEYADASEEQVARDAGLVWEPPPGEREMGEAWPGPIQTRRDLRAEILHEERELAEPRLRQ